MYVPLGELLPGMGYLVRRLLENTSNESFLRHTFFERSKIDELLADPAEEESSKTAVTLPLPSLQDEVIPPPTQEALPVQLDY
jgi:RHH-type proline utilization regulon transcriptional repressor/proline dehydrogenase/delta 1-pyrroline-5-carboxylate dehydrogenase